MYTTATKQEFNGRRVKLGMVVLTVDTDGSGNDRAVPAQCVEIHSDDMPCFRVAESSGYPKRLEFVASESMLAHGKWTWPERV